MSIESPTTKHAHRWTEAQMREFIGMWIAGKELDHIAEHFKLSPRSISKMAMRLRRNGVPLPKRNPGHRAGRYNKPWTQEEVEYLIRRRNEKATAEQIADELDRTYNGVAAIIGKLRSEGVNVRLLGQGTRRLWSAEKLRAAIAGRGLRLVSSESEEAA